MSTPTDIEQTGEENSTGTTITAPEGPEPQHDPDDHTLGEEHTHNADCVGGCIHKEPGQ